MSESSVWVTGESGSIYERFWNGLQWVIAPHELPVSAGYAVSVFIVNQTILALSEAAVLYQMQLDENGQPAWIDFSPNCKMIKEKEPCSATQLVSGVVSPERKRIYFCTKNGSLIELTEVNPPRWKNHGRPAGADVAAIADAAAFRPEVVFTISATGDLYEFDQNSKPSWKKHIHKEASTQDTLLRPSTGCTLHGLNGAQSSSLFLLSKGGNLTERRLQQRKWKWIYHGSPRDLSLTSITCVGQENQNENAYSLFLTTATGNVLEYRLPTHSGTSKENENPDNWVNHMHPSDAKAARGIVGVQLQPGRMIFPLDDGRLGELHFSGIGGENIGPNYQVNTKRKVSPKYVWSVLDAPETEGWNAEYCTEENGPSNCISGIRDDTSEADNRTPTTRRRKGSKSQQNYLPIITSGTSSATPLEDYDIPDDWINKNFRLRVMHEGKSFFLITEDGMTFEYLNAENVWFWLSHDQSTAMKGAVGSYNGSLFLVDEQGSLLIRERTNSELAWIDCTVMRGGSQVTSGPPWDGLSGRAPRATLEDALFFVSKAGRLLQFRVALRKFKWKDCRNPPNTKIASIVDREIFRENIVFVIGSNGRLYQYNKVTELWHEHLQSQHLVLSKVPGTAMRPSPLSSKGSLFMLSEDGGLVEYNWNSLDGWNWVEHGTPDQSVTLVGSPGPCFRDSQLFLIGSNGRVYLRLLDQGTWQWRDCGFPYIPEEKAADKSKQKGTCRNEDFAARTPEFEENLHPSNKHCDTKVSSTRPIAFTEDSVIFELRDGRLAQMRRAGGMDWRWSHTIGTPTSQCTENFWTALAS
ncbi:PREDICTED: uncharacterized protein LOC109152368 [Ipomoea nil]|uniref:uncharacterized protein LOC109152368 n=1 Tax=Ipomoea nil TaxID=35883 RepID=UPI000900E23D|nr:PREDICTED: uncharacterized protein LOC109152368 [Ipomoea nil]